MKSISYRRRALTRAIVLSALLAAALTTASCGEDSAEPSGPTVTQRVTRDFGRELLSSQEEAPLEGQGTLLRLLKGYEEIKTMYGARLITSIDGLKSVTEEDHETIWVQNVNGIETDEFPPDYKLYPGDVVQWDLRDWYVTLDVRATVGAFPQTFTQGVFGKRFPVEVRCEDAPPAACRRVKAALGDAGVDIDGSRPAGGLPPRGQVRRARVLVGPWKSLRDARYAHPLDMGPRYSGVFARFSPGAGALNLLHWNAHKVRSEGAGTGLVAAMRPTEADLLWLVTGVDDEGVERAAEALATPQLRDAFAVVVTPDGVEKVPLPPN